MKEIFAIKSLKINSKKNPSNIAFEKNSNKISYKKFWNDCKKFSILVSGSNEKPVVAIIGNHDYFDYVCMFGTLMSGGTYVPINNDLPMYKIKNIISIAKCNFLTSSKITLLKKINQKNIKNIDEKNFFSLNIIKSKKTKQNKKSKIAYIIFTSGSTGKPKGVKITRKNLDTYLKWVVTKLKIHNKSKCTQLPGIGFDLSVADIYSTICGGGTLCLPNQYNKIFPGQYIKQNKITHIVCVPSLINVIENSKQLNKSHFKSVKKIFFCGEPLMKEHLTKLFQANKNINVINAYGPTETTVSCTSIDLNKVNYKSYSKYSMCIGKSIPGTKIHLLKNNKISTKEGEIVISGDQVADGYLNDKINNKKKFIIFKKKKSFLTGDIGELVDKKFFFKKRIDNQIKIKGFRVELDEIDFYLRKIGFEYNFTVFTKNKLISFIQSKKVKKEFIVKRLIKLIPSYMIPDEIRFIKKFPLNINGKIDKKKLLEKINEEK